MIGRHAAGVMNCTTNAFLVIKKIIFIKKTIEFCTSQPDLVCINQNQYETDIKQVSGEYQGHIIGVEMKFASTGQ